MSMLSQQSPGQTAAMAGSWRRYRTARVLVAGMLLGTLSAGALAADKKGWQATYTGDLTGSVGGSIVVPGGTSMVSMVRGASMSKDKKSMGTAALSVKVMRMSGQEPRLYQLDLTLEDGTVCRLQQDGREKVDMHDTSAKSYAASFSGTLACDGGKTISVEAWARK